MQTTWCAASYTAMAIFFSFAHRQAVVSVQNAVTIVTTDEVNFHDTIGYALITIFGSRYANDRGW